MTCAQRQRIRDQKSQINLFNTQLQAERAKVGEMKHEFIKLRSESLKYAAGEIWLKGKVERLSGALQAVDKRGRGGGAKGKEQQVGCGEGFTCWSDIAEAAKALVECTSATALNSKIVTNRLSALEGILGITHYQAADADKLVANMKKLTNAITSISTG